MSNKRSDPNQDHVWTRREALITGAALVAAAGTGALVGKRESRSRRLAEMGASI